MAFSGLLTGQVRHVIRSTLCNPACTDNPPSPRSGQSGLLTKRWRRKENFALYLAQFIYPSTYRLDTAICSEKTRRLASLLNLLYFWSFFLFSLLTLRRPSSNENPATSLRRTPTYDEQTRNPHQTCRQPQGGLFRSLPPPLLSCGSPSRNTLCHPQPGSHFLLTDCWFVFARQAYASRAGFQ